MNAKWPYTNYANTLCCPNCGANLTERKLGDPEGPDPRLQHLECEPCNIEWVAM